jgi:hypothetical protein
MFATILLQIATALPVFAQPALVDGIFHVTDWGAQCDGSTDDTVAIQATINAAAGRPGGHAKVELPAGVCNVSAAIVDDVAYMDIEGAGERATILQLVAGVPDVAAVVVIGSAGTVPSPGLFNLAIEAGSNFGHTSGAGIAADSADMVIQNVYVAHTPEDAIRVVPSTVAAQDLLDNVYINYPGRDGLVIGQNATDSDFRRVIVKGGAPTGPPAGRHGIYSEGKEVHLDHCHPYFMAGDGLHVDAGWVQVIGGEYESNNGFGISLSNLTGDYSVVGVTGFYGNASGDISVADVGDGHYGTVTGNTFRSPAPRNIIIGHAAGGAITANTFKMFTSEGVLLSGAGADNWSIQSNMFDGASASSRSLMVNSLHNTITGNVFVAHGPVEGAAADYNAWVGNSMNGTSLGVVGSHSSQTSNSNP